MDNKRVTISALLRALDDSDPRSAIRAFCESINALAGEFQASPDYDQVLALMAGIERHYRNRTWQPLIAAAVHMALERSVSAQRADKPTIFNRPSPWQAEYQQLTAEIAQAARRPQALELILSCDKQVLTRFPLDPAPFEHLVSGIRPGYCEVRTDTGWRLWACQLQPADLLLGAACPRRPLQLAAQTKPAAPQPTKSASLGATSLFVSVYPGVQSGLICIQRRARY